MKRWNSPSAKPRYRTLEEMLDMKHFLCCVEEPYGMPTEEEHVPRISDINYGHVVGALNEADKNEWDVIFPGFEAALNLVICYEVVGYVHDTTGNHKLIGVCFDVPGFSEEEFTRQLKKYTQKRRKVYDPGCQAKLFKDVSTLLDKIEY